MSGWISMETVNLQRTMRAVRSGVCTRLAGRQVSSVGPGVRTLEYCRYFAFTPTTHAGVGTFSGDAARAAWTLQSARLQRSKNDHNDQRCLVLASASTSLMFLQFTVTIWFSSNQNFLHGAAEVPTPQKVWRRLFPWATGARQFTTCLQVTCRTCQSLAMDTSASPSAP